MKQAVSLPCPTTVREPAFADAQKWWKPMRQSATFPGVPGHPWQPSVLWNAGLLFWPLPRDFNADGIRHGGTPGLAGELDGREADALHIDFSFGPRFEIPDRLNSEKGRISQSLEDGRMPIIHSRLTHGGINWSCAVFCRLPDGMEAARGDEVLLTEVHWTARNPGRTAVAAELNAHLACPHVHLGYKVRITKALPYQRVLRLENALILDNRGKARLATVIGATGRLEFIRDLPRDLVKGARTDLAGAGLTSDVLRVTARIPARGVLRVRLLVPFFPTEPGVLQDALRIGAGRAFSAVRAYWRRQLTASGSICTPEPILNDSCDAYLYQAMLATGRKPRSGHWILKTSPNNYEGLWGAHASIGAFSMDLRGQHRWARKVFDTFLANQGPVPTSLARELACGSKSGEGYSKHPGFLGNIEGHMAILWAFYHGWTMWAIGRHARLSGDWRWFRKQIPRLVLACEWTAEQRRRTMRTDTKGRRVVSWGLLPAGNAFDWGYGHMFWSDAHTYRGLREIADCLAMLRRPQARRWRAEAEAYRRDIVASVTRCRDTAPRVPVSPGRSIPYVPMAPEMPDFFGTDWTYVSCGPLNLCWAGVVPPDHELVDQTLAYLEAGRPLGKWDPAKKKRQGWDWGVRAKADEEFLPCTRPRSGRAFLWRHKMCYEPGWIPQTFTWMYRDDIPSMLEHLYSLTSNGGQYVNLRGPVEQRDGVPWCQPGQASLLWVIRDMLLREDGNSLVLCGSCPRRWLRDGEQIGVSGLPTHFGRVGFRLTSAVGRGRVHGTFDFRWRSRPESIRLRLRHPRGIEPVLALADGAPVTLRGEWVTMPPDTKNIDVRYGSKA